MNPPPSDAAVCDRAVSLASESLSALRLQRRRLNSADPDDATFVLRWWTDLQLFIVLLRRLLRSAELVGRLPHQAALVKDAVGEFEAAIPSLRRMRNMGEHVDDYALDSARRREPVDRRSLQTGQWDRATFAWLGGALNVDDALEAAERLYETLRCVRSQVTAARPESGHE